MHPPQPPKRTAFLSAIAAGLGLAAGGAAWVLLNLIDLITNLAVFGRVGFDPPSFSTLEPSPRIVIVAVAGALAISALAKWSPVIRGHGIPETMEAVLTKESRIAPRTAVAKPLSAAVAIGTTAPFGAEGPIIVTGGALGSLAGQLLRVSASERKILLACGAAAGMAAIFGAPLASIVLAVELLLFEFSTRALIPLVVAASVAGGMHAALFGPGPLFQVPEHDLSGLGALPAFALLGVAAGLLALVITKGLFKVEALYRRLPIGESWHPVIGALAFSCVGLLEPRALGVGYDAIDDVLNNRLAIGTVAVLGAVKLITWWLALGSGTSGGTLAPILLISASAGTLVGVALNEVLPGQDVPVGLFAVVAMAATFGAATRATFAAIVFVFELTRDYEIVLPLLLATVIADLVFSSMSSDSIMTEKLTRRGLRIGRHYGVDPMATTPVAAIMTHEVLTLGADMSVDDARKQFIAEGHGAYPVLDPDSKMLGIVERRRTFDDDLDPTSPVAMACREVGWVQPEDHAIDALHQMIDEHTDHVPVLESGRLVGICTRTDLLKVRRRQRSLEEPQPGIISSWSAPSG
jgi:H+/Cl- antiporter ClcA